MLRTRCLAGALIVAGCRGGEPPAPTGLDGAVAALPPPPGQTEHAGEGSAATPEGRDAGAGRADAGAAPAVALAAGLDPGTLPQTHDKPEAAGAAFEARVAALWDAVVKDDPDLAMPSFFPVTAYEQVKAIPNASSDWRRRLVAAFKRDIHALHKRLGDHASSATRLRVDVPEDRARWVEPGEESNKLGYFRVYGTRLVYAVEGKERSLEVTSLISWRGEWYVVHLSGFK
jgi:hypothetical protein